MDGSNVAGSESKKMHFEELHEFGLKRSKIRDLESVFRSEGKMKLNTDSTFDLNANDDAPSCVEDIKHMGSKIDCVKSRGLSIDLNLEDVSECGSTRNLGSERDSMKVWKEMKQNGFLTSSHGGVPMPHMPKSRGRKRGNELVNKKKIEIAKKEQVDRFAKVAAPSGLLDDLNPGIINHVRNRKQVHSIIENLVRSARSENKRRGSKLEIGKESCHSDLVTSNHRSYDKLGCEDDVLALKHSSSAKMVSNTSSLSNENSGNISTVNSLSITAASVASQWLELLHQDIKGRLSALRHSKKRVRSVIETELPSLLSQELVSNQENSNSENGNFVMGTADLHKARWGTLFVQMENTLTEEEKQLEGSLNEVNEMLMHCKHGLLQFHPTNGLQKCTNEYRLLKAETSPPYKGLAVQAAAAAIYSTSNLLQSMEKQPCF